MDPAARRCLAPVERFSQKGPTFVHGFEIYLERATLLYESSTCPLMVLTADGKTEHPKFAGGQATTAFTAELQAAIEGVHAGRAPDLLSAKLARDALVLCHKECQSVLSGEVIGA